MKLWYRNDKKYYIYVCLCDYVIFAVDITYNDLVTCLPFGNTIDIVDVQGRYISQALEHAATAFVGQQNTTNFLQVSGRNEKFVFIT